MARKPRGYSIRPAGVCDVSRLVAQRRALFMEIGRDKESVDRMCKKYRTWVLAGLKSRLYRAWVAVDGKGEVVAGAGLRIIGWPPVPADLTERRAYVFNVYTNPPHRRRGIARMLMRAMLDWCRSNGFITVALHTTDDGRSLYESLGFEPTTEMRLHLVTKPPARKSASARRMKTHRRRPT